MFDKNRHRTVLIQILKEIYSDVELRNILGFKGGTAAFLFYDLPRLSVDLDFDLLKEEGKKIVFEKMEKILSQFGEVIEAVEKRNTLFFLLSYEKGEKKIKVEISKRENNSLYEVKNYLGISVLLAKKEDIIAGKLSAFLTRTKFAARDLFDLWFFLKNNWLINEKIIKKYTGFNLNKALEQAIDKLNKIQKNQLLQGLGELLDDKQKAWVKEKLKEELSFYLKLYLEQLK